MAMWMPIASFFFDTGNAENTESCLRFPSDAHSLSGCSTSISPYPT